MKDLIRKNLNGKRILLLFVLTNIVYAIMLIITIPKVMSFSGGMKLLDMMPTGYSAEYVNALLSALGEKGRNAYLFTQFPIDMIYPFLFGVSSCLILAYFLNKLGKFESRLFYFCLLPLFSGLFDYLENIGIIAMLKSYPNNPVILSQITNVFSVMKSTFTTFYFIVLIIFIVMFGMNKLFQKSR